MKIDDPNLSPMASADAARAQGLERAGAGRNPAAPENSGALGDDVHLSELVRILRAMAIDSPERQAYLEDLARTYANGAYRVDAEATAARIIDDAFASQ